MDDMYARQNELSDILLGAFAEMLDLQQDTFSQHFLNDMGTIRLLKYPPIPRPMPRQESPSSEASHSEGGEEKEEENAKTVGIAAHTDFEFFTLMWQDHQGLQLQSPAPVRGGGGGGGGGDDGSIRYEWIDAPAHPRNTTAAESMGMAGGGGGGGGSGAPPSSFLVIPGDMFERFTNGVVRAMPHRVLPSYYPCSGAPGPQAMVGEEWHSPKHEVPPTRYSIIRFHALNPDAIIQPLPQFVSEDRPSRYTPVSMKTHMDTTITNLRNGIPCWEDGDPGRSLSAAYRYESP